MDQEKEVQPGIEIPGELEGGEESAWLHEELMSDLEDEVMIRDRRELGEIPPVSPFSLHGTRQPNLRELAARRTAPSQSSSASEG